MFVNVLGAIALGIPVTVLVTVMSLLLGLILGIPLAMGLRSGLSGVRILVRSIVNVIRAVPILMWLFLVYFGVSIGAFHFQPFPAAVIVLGLTTACYFADVYRTAFESVGRGQYEAGRSMGLNRAQTFFHIVLPQGIVVALPAMSTFALTLLKDSSIPSIIGVLDISHATTAVARSTGAALLAYSAAAICYLALSVVLGVAMRALTKRLEARV